ncbi:transmembrane protein 45A-like [Cucurbita moschata]|uniref:Transmembrane protein 45A-like n=1 Tax=Cucurbita moschata TaxID=3662 RepID=A0A6J1FXU7_CUCMO|nr:transmembrane protein 45A-like [Cucurbita moschata]
MGTLVGHVAPGFGFFIIGLWHLFNNIKIEARTNPPNSPIFLSWFPTSRFKYLEPLLIMLGASASVAMELFIGPQRHHPFDTDGTIPSNHLHNIEHSNISMTFFVFAAFSVILDRLRPKAYFELTQFLGAVAFGQELLLFHLHSADHNGPEGQYHMLLQLLVLLSLATTLLGIALPTSFLVAFIRSFSIIFQGVWLMLMGFTLWTPSLISKGCFMHLEDGHKVVRCGGEAPFHRAKSLINIQFSWLLTALTIFALSFHLFLLKLYQQTPKNPQYISLVTNEEEEETSKNIDTRARSFIEMGHKFKEII